MSIEKQIFTECLEELLGDRELTDLSEPEQKKIMEMATDYAASKFGDMIDHAFEQVRDDLTTGGETE